jgi:hypothetical protein
MTSLAPVTSDPADVAAGLPRERGGWWHDLVCPAHGTELSHAGIPGPVPPAGGVRCPHGCVVATELVRGAWLVLSHQAWARRARVLAHRAARTGDEAARTEAVALLVAYADVYAEVAGGGEHERAQDWMLRGRLFHQALTDAIWAVSVGHAVWSLAEADPDRADDLAPVLGLLDATAEAARAARARLVGDGRFTSNYTAWLNAAGRVCSRARAPRGGGPPPAPRRPGRGRGGGGRAPRPGRAARRVSQAAPALPAFRTRSLSMAKVQRAPSRPRMPISCWST